ncbi:MAG: hypothetical protein RLP13_09255 [Cytophagales bacterium]
MAKRIILFQVLLIVSLISCSKKNSSTENAAIHSQADNEERLEFISGKDTLVGYLSKPQNIQSYPVIVVLHSASHGHHDNELYNHLETHMKDLGVGEFS